MTELAILLCLVGGLLFVAFRIASSRLEREVNETVIPKSVPQLKSIQPPIFLSTIAPTQQQKTKAVMIILVLIACFIMVIPFAGIDGPNIPAFPPLDDALLCVMYFVTGFIILGQFQRLRTWSMLILGTGFMFESLMAIEHAISFPGFFHANVFGMQAAVWLYQMWHLGFPPFVIAYAYFHGKYPRRLIIRPKLASVLMISSTIVCSVGAALACIQWEAYLPTLINVGGGDYTKVLTFWMGPTFLLLNIITLVMLWLRGDSVLDLWLFVATCSSLLDITVGSIIGGHRFDVSYYVGRGYGLLSTSLVLGALLEEMNRLYASLFSQMISQQERDDAKYHAIFNTTVDAIIVIDRIGTIKAFNKAAERMFGYAQDIIGQNVRVLMPEPFYSAHDQYLQNYQQTGIHKIIGRGREVRGKRQDGTSFEIDLAVAEWFNGNEQLFTGILRNISDRKHIEQQLIQSQKMEAIGQLTGGMAHDFNNILGVVIGNLDMLEERFEQTPEELTDALVASMAGAKLVQQLLAFARRQPLQPKIIFLNEVVESLIPMLSRVIGGAIEIETHFDANLWPVVADPTQFENALLNLVINARDAMPNGGKLLIECCAHTMDRHSSIEYDVPTGTYTTLIVSDTGTGIPSDILERIFDPFFTTKAPGMGSGLGLSMVHGYAKQSGGLVRVYSEINQGTTVRLYLPSATEEDTINSETGGLHGTERILIVEDTSAARVVAERILLSLGYTVRVAGNANEALSIICNEEPFDMLFTDIVMPGISGIQLASQIRQQHPMIKILFASGFSRTPLEEIERLGATYINKPYSKIDIATMIRNIFNKGK